MRFRSLLEIILEGGHKRRKSRDFFKAGTKKQVEITVVLYKRSGNHCGYI